MKHVPERTCIACRGKFPQAELIRIRKTSSGWSLDPITVGRSVYVCHNPLCHTEKKLKRMLGAQTRELVAQLSCSSEIKPHPVE